MKYFYLAFDSDFLTTLEGRVAEGELGQSYLISCRFTEENGFSSSDNFETFIAFVLSSQYPYIHLWYTA